jgi:hypothetical protein
VAALVALAAGGQPVTYLRFWGRRPRRDGSVGPGCLSQWWPAPFTVEGVTYATAEHWMMVGKARLFGDAEAERRVLAARQPKEAKDAGRAVRGFDDAVWERERFALVAEGSTHKFGRHPDLRDFLARHRAAGIGRGEPAGPRLGHRPGRRRRPGGGPRLLARPESPRLRPHGGQETAGAGSVRGIVEAARLSA